MRTPRPYQIAAHDAVLAEFAKLARTLVVLPTGTGKTVLFAKLAKHFADGQFLGLPANVLILAHRRELVEQAQNKVGDELGYMPPIEMAQRGLDIGTMFDAGMVVVGSVQTMINEKRLERFRRTPFGLIIIDEAHHAVAASYVKIIDFFMELNPRLKILGVTATPRRADEAALGIVFESCAYKMEMQDAITDGWLVPIKQEFVYLEEVDFSHLQSRQNDMGEQDFNQSDLEAVMVEEEALHGMATPILEKAKDQRGLIFTAGVAHAHLLAGIMNRERAGCAAAVDGKTDSKLRQEIVSNFRTGRIQFLTNYGVFTEGFDVPTVGIVAMGRPTRSVGLYTQMLGRGTRPLDGLVDGQTDADERRLQISMSEKPCVHVLDFVGNSRHRLVSSFDVLGGNYDLRVRDLAKERAQRGAVDVEEALEEAKKQFLDEKEQERRRTIRAKVAYGSEQVDPFSGSDYGEQDQCVPRGGSSDSQIQFLVNLGVNRETAAGYSKRQASAVIESLKAKRCTVKQANVLRRHGFSPDVPFEKAGEIITRIANSGWTLRGDSDGAGSN